MYKPKLYRCTSIHIFEIHAHSTRNAPLCPTGRGAPAAPREEARTGRPPPYQVHVAGAALAPALRVQHVWRRHLRLLEWRARSRSANTPYCFSASPNMNNISDYTVYPIIRETNRAVNLIANELAIKFSPCQ